MAVSTPTDFFPASAAVRRDNGRCGRVRRVGIPWLIVWWAWLVLGISLHADTRAAAQAATDAHSSAPTPTSGALTIHAPNELSGLKTHLERAFPAVETFVGERLGATYAGPVTVYVATDTRHVGAVFAEIFNLPQPRTIPRGFAGWAVPSRGVIVLNVEAYRHGYIYDEAISTLRHEYGHLVMGQYASEADTVWPKWFEEGVCQWIERSVGQPNRIVEGVRSGTISPPPLAELSDMIAARGDFTQEGYALSESAVRFLMGQRPVEQQAERMRRLAEKLAQHGEFGAAFADVFGESVGSFERRWHAHASPGGVAAVAHFIGSNLTGLLFGGMALIFILALLVRRRRNQKILDTLDP